MNWPGQTCFSHFPSRRLPRHVPLSEISFSQGRPRARRCTSRPCQSPLRQDVHSCLATASGPPHCPLQIRRAYGNCHRRHALKCRLAIRTLPEALLRNEQVPEAWKSARTYLCCKNAFLFDACMHTPFRGGLSIFHFYLSCLRQRPNCCIPYPSSIP